MWMDDNDAPTQNQFFQPSPGATLGAEGQSVIALIGVVCNVVNRHKAGDKTIFCIADLKVGDGHMAARIVDEYQAQCQDATRLAKVSGFETNQELLEKAEAALSARNALGILRVADVTSTPGGRLRNSLECGAGADLVLYTHAAYPRKLENSKLPRMVDRLGDMVLEKGVIVTLHNYGPADLDDIRTYILGLPMDLVAGAFCNTQGRLEQSFEQHRELHCFSVTVPNTIDLPANIEAMKAILSGYKDRLSGKDANDAVAIQTILAMLAGGQKQLHNIIHSMDAEQQAKAISYFERRIAQAQGSDLPITIGGGQMLMAFKSAAIAQEAFTVINEACQQMVPPAIALPVSSSVMPEFDKTGAHGTWAAKLQEFGISPPQVHQVVASRENY